MSLTTAQLQVLKTGINTNTDPAFVAYRNAGATNSMANWYNQQAAPAFVCWDGAMPLADFGKCMNGAEMAALSLDNTTRLQTFQLFFLNGGVANTGNANVRSFFSDIFLDANESYAALEARYHVNATNCQKLYAKTTPPDDGTYLFPAVMTVISIGNQDIIDALALP